MAPRGKKIKFNIFASEKTEKLLLEGRRICALYSQLVYTIEKNLLLRLITALNYWPLYAISLGKLLWAEKTEVTDYPSAQKNEVCTIPKLLKKSWVQKTLAAL